MIHIQALRKNDINPDGGKQVEFGKAFFEKFNWKADTSYKVTFHTEKNISIVTTLTVRGSGRGGERVGADCKEYKNENNEFPLKDFFIHTMKFTEDHVGNVFLVFESLDKEGAEFNLFFTPHKKDNKSFLPHDYNIRSRFIKYWSLTDQHGADYESYVKAFEGLLNPILAEECGINSVFEITDAAQYKDVIQRFCSKYNELAYLLDENFPSGSKALPYSTNKKYSVFLQVLACTNGVTNKHKLCGSLAKESANLYPYLTAIRTKPFILLAGISGTGKSRIVRKLAQATDTIGCYADDAARFACHSPENFCLIQVKPNWHNSMDVVGFKSNIGKDGEHYEFTPFVEFIAKAWQHPDVPFFLCLDEMNLAPVEEYFAEFLSAIESRSIDLEGNYETDYIIRPFQDFGEDVCNQMITHLLGTEPDTILAERFTTKGLTLPQNLIVMGTVNMDETTFSFSRKVLDRAMSIEMNEVDYDAFLEGSTEMDVPVLVENNALLIKRFIKAQDVKDNIDAQTVKDFLNDVNNILEGTPFKLGYRAANEAILYVSAAKDFGNDDLAAALDEFTLMKVLSRIEGDDTKLRTMMGEDILQELNHLFSTGMFSGMKSSKTLAKLNQMIKSLERDHFVSFWG